MRFPTKFGTRYGVGDSTPPAPVVFSPHREFGSFLSDYLGVPVGWGNLPNYLTGPRVVYHIIDLAPVTSLQGGAGLDFWHLELDCIDTDLEGPPIKQARIKKLLETYRGPMGLAYCQGATVSRGFSDFSSDAAESAGGLFRESSDWTLALTN